MQVSQISEQKSPTGPRAKAEKTAAGFGDALQEVILRLGVCSAAQGTAEESILPGAAHGLSQKDGDSSGGQSGGSRAVSVVQSGLAAMLAALGAESPLPLPSEKRTADGPETAGAQMSSLSQRAASAPGADGVSLRAGIGRSALSFASPAASGVCQASQAADIVSPAAVGTVGRDPQATPGFPAAFSMSAGSVSVPAAQVSADGPAAAAEAGIPAVSAFPPEPSAPQTFPVSPASSVSQTSQVPQVLQDSQFSQVSQSSQDVQASQFPRVSRVPQRAAAQQNADNVRPVSRAGGSPDSSGQSSPVRAGGVRADVGTVRREQPRENANRFDSQSDGQSPITGGTVLSPFRAYLQANDRAAAADAPFPTENVAQQLAGALKNSADGGRSELRLHLSPADLGGINIRLVSQGGQVTLRITADNSNTGQMLASGLDDLNRAMSHSGVHMDRTEISYSSADSSGGGQPDSGSHSFAGGSGSSDGGRHPAAAVYPSRPETVSARQAEEPVWTASPGAISIFA